MSENDALPYAGISLLYVEDEAATREQVSRVLATRGYRLVVAENGEQGLAAFRDTSPDIVLTDIMMPRLNGLEMAREIRALAPEAQIACMTAFSDTGYMIEAIDIGVNQFVLKPVEFHRLFAALDRCQEVVELRKRQKMLEAESLRTKKAEAIAVLAGGIAHDFNNLLQIILGYVSLARMNAEPGSNTETLLAIAEQSSDSAKELSGKLLIFAKGGDAFARPTQPGPPILKGIKAGLMETSLVKPVIDLPADLPLVMLDAEQLEHVVTNLVSNAREAMPQGGTLHVSASVSPQTATNDLGLPSGDYLHIIFEDTGIGIPPENLPKIFDPYFSTKEMGCQKGMGLGLAQCYSIIKHYHGNILAASQLGEGTCIHIYLPVCHAQE